MEQKRKRNLREHVNLGVIVFLVIVIYLTAYVVTYLGKEKLAIYEVSQSNISDSIIKKGMILREESVVETEEEGYVNYYVKDGSRVKQGGVVYTVDTTGKIQSYISTLLNKKDSVGTEEKKQVYEDLKVFSDSFSDTNFSEVYEAKNNIDKDLISYTDTIIADNKEKLEKKYGANSYIEEKAKESGLVSFSSDGLEDIDEESLTRIKFNSGAKMNNLRSEEKMEAGSPVYRIVTDQKWTLALPVSKDEYKRIKKTGNQEKGGQTVLPVTFQKDNFSTKATVECQKKKDGYYAFLHFDNYVQRYIDQRYLTVELLLSETEGLKIPTSALVKKEVYKIPSSYLTAGSNSSKKNQVNVLTKNKKGEEVLTQAKVSVYKTEGDNVLITSEKLKTGDKISDLEKAKTYTLKTTSQLKGVYVVNQGYAVFRAVEVIKNTEDYCIISSEQSKLELYDRVILNSETIKENQVIY
ncbi:MAG: HlyD family efflux transporter periplasmic adaptor subunit [Eubacteriales bacterium]|nr:HlyD family efflux transporter periplasmic adaptor subunit [Eubacteriales bacterium]